MYTPQAGKAVTARYLKAAVRLLNNGHFRYVNEWTGKDSAVLRFTARIDDIAINGIDINQWNVDDTIVGFKAMVRPLKAIDVLPQRMAEGLIATARMRRSHHRPFPENTGRIQEICTNGEASAIFRARAASRVRSSSPRSSAGPASKQKRRVERRAAGSGRRC